MVLEGTSGFASASVRGCTAREVLWTVVQAIIVKTVHPTAEWRGLLDGEMLNVRVFVVQEGDHSMVEEAAVRRGSGCVSKPISVEKGPLRILETLFAVSAV